MVTCFLAVAEGRRLSAVKPNFATKPTIAVYTTALHCTCGVSFPGELRIYSPFKDVVLVDNTVYYVAAEAYFPSTVPKISLEASHFYPLPGNPSSDIYKQTVPDCLVPYPPVMSCAFVPRCMDVLGSPCDLRL
ncbi:hypothetical protein EDD16DRAFT_193878 [Pisolithus croceorrhizus]|nr:hypothetical protein EDD16DRAFT_193878 [Pisolithus croceorrhizus]KAI6107426.1 hypothetical protein EV401DRAFT_443599 [Pisolithus croceorrhizus]KAI6142912.1 hypothetical protein EDD17DRAFT_1660913 [Pisolithus thermaeus]